MTNTPFYFNFMELIHC